MGRDSSPIIPDNTRRAKITGCIKRSKYQVYLEYEGMNPKTGRKPASSSDTCDYFRLICMFYEATHVKVTVVDSMMIIVKVL
jgi:hypothetical protein